VDAAWQAALLFVNCWFGLFTGGNVLPFHDHHTGHLCSFVLFLHHYRLGFAYSRHKVLPAPLPHLPLRYLGRNAVPAFASSAPWLPGVTTADDFGSMLWRVHSSARMLLLLAAATCAGA